VCCCSGLVVDLCFVAEFDNVDEYWIDNNAQHIMVVHSLPVATPKCITTYPNHRFFAKSGERVIEEYTVKEDQPQQIFVVKNPNLNSRECKIFDATEEDYQKCFLDKVVIPDTFAFELRRKSGRDSRAHHNEVQPRLAPHFTKIGFEKRKIPDDLWKIIKDFYDANKLNYAREKWPIDDTVVNFYDSPSYMVHLDSIRSQIYEKMQPLLEEWSGVQKLDPTSCYGIRYYLRGAVLENHVDRLKTHAISAIINVDQDPNMSEPWLLEIFDHDRNVHHIEMQPGEMVFYESAACVHGRPTPFKGKYYANFFVHFAPQDRSIWNFPSDRVDDALALGQRS
jgi:hypothetical protein